MRIEYSQHIEARLQMRGIDYALPKRIFEDARERYLDRHTGHLIAIMNAELYGKTREVMTAYVATQDHITLLTIHPLKTGQKNGRVRSGRWRRIQ